MIVCRTAFDTGILGLQLIRKSTVHHGIFVLQILNFSSKNTSKTIKRPYLLRIKDGKMCGSICECGSLSLMSKLMYASLGSFVHKVQHLSHDINHCLTEITRFSPSLWQQVMVIVPCTSDLQSSINRVCELNTTN